MFWSDRRKQTEELLRRKKLGGAVITGRSFARLFFSLFEIGAAFFGPLGKLLEGQLWSSQQAVTHRSSGSLIRIIR